jgi:FkbM family methyltransferase
MRRVLRSAVRFVSTRVWFKGRAGLVFRIGKLLQTRDGAIEYRLWDGSSMVLDLADPMQMEMYYRTYEGVERDLIVALLSPGNTFFDVGAHVGYYTIAAARKVGPTGAVHSFEPRRENADLLERSVQSNQFRHVKVNRQAVCDRTGAVELYVPDAADYGREASGWATVLIGIFPNATVETIPGVSIDDYIMSHQIKAVHLIKMDIEGAEVFALQGMKKVLRSTHPPRILTEINALRLRDAGCEPTSIHSLLSQYGYKSYRVVGRALLREDTIAFSDSALENCLFLPPGDTLLAGSAKSIRIDSLSRVTA